MTPGPLEPEPPAGYRGGGLLIAIPHSRAAFPAGFSRAIQALTPVPGLPRAVWCLSSHSGIAQKRTEICRQAVRIGFDYMLMVDDDVIAPVHTALDLFRDLELNPDAALAAGICLLRWPGRGRWPNVWRRDWSGPYLSWRKGEVFEVSKVGFGCAMVRVSALSSVPEPWFDASPHYGVHEGLRYALLSAEDGWFCRQARLAGWRIIADGGVLCDHYAGAAPLGPPQPAPGLALRGGALALQIGEWGRPDARWCGRTVRLAGLCGEWPDYRADARALPFASAAFDAVRIGNLFGHFADPSGWRAVLAEAARVSRPGAGLFLAGPHLRSDPELSATKAHIRGLGYKGIHAALLGAELVLDASLDSTSRTARRRR